MELNIRAGMRVLYKENNQWNIGTIDGGTAFVTDDTLLLRIISKETNEIITIKANDIFFDAFKLEDWIKDYPKYFMSKEDYIKFIESDEFDKRLENACVSDGEYGYYPVSKYSRQWLEKQPFNYIVRSD